MCSINTSPPRVTLLATGPGQSVLAEVEQDQVRTLAYSAYGVQGGAQPAVSRPGFNGQLRERPEGWYHLGHGRRLFSPVLMRFCSPDRLSPFGRGGLNAYAYCLGDPLNLVDPTAKQAEPMHYLTLIMASLSQVVGIWSLAMPRILANPPPGSRRARWAEGKPGIAGPIGGLDAVVTFAGMVNGGIGAGATLLNMQQPQLPPSQDLMYAGFALGATALVAKFGILSAPTLFPPGSRGRKMGVMLHGEKKVSMAEEAARRARERSRSRTPGADGADDLPMQVLADRRRSSVSDVFPAAPPPSPAPMPRRSLMRSPSGEAATARLEKLENFARMLRLVRAWV